MQLYARVFTQILDSSIAENFLVRHVFEDLLKICDYRTGVVDVTREALSRRLNIPLSELQEVINKLESPDPKSRDQTCEGRRIVRLDNHRDWGWRITNWEKYDKIRSRVDGAIRVARHRASKASSEAEQIYAEYPRKVAKPKAIKEIEHQLEKYGFEALLKATKQFAEVWKGKSDMSFCPHPSSWFHQERFNDSPETWNPSYAPKERTPQRNMI